MLPWVSGTCWMVLRTTVLVFTGHLSKKGGHNIQQTDRQQNTLEVNKHHQFES
jgi:hypothetical protein